MYKIFVWKFMPDKSASGNLCSFKEIFVLSSAGKLLLQTRNLNYNQNIIYQCPNKNLCYAASKKWGLGKDICVCQDKIPSLGQVCDHIK